MKQFSITFLFFCLVSLLTLTAQFGCSSAPATSQNLATAPPTVSPSPTLEPTPLVVIDSSSPAAGSGSTAVVEKPASIANAPAKKVTSGSAGAADSEPSAPRPAAQVAERAAPPPPPRTSTLFEGRAISVFTSSDLSTKTARSGQKFTASLANPI